MIFLKSQLPFQLSFALQWRKAPFLNGTTSNQYFVSNSHANENIYLNTIFSIFYLIYGKNLEDKYIYINIYINIFI